MIDKLNTLKNNFKTTKFAYPLFERTIFYPFKLVFWMQHLK